MHHTITVLPQGITLTAPQGERLLSVLRAAGLAPDAPCGGRGSCGKCRVRVDGREVLSCQYAVTGDITVGLPEMAGPEVLTAGQAAPVRIDPLRPGPLLAFDIGTTTVVCFLLAPDGRELAVESMLNPQASYGADVVTRIQSALGGNLEALTTAIRTGMTELIEKVCEKAGVRPEEIGVVSVVGNPCMQQLFLGLSPENLAAIPFAPVLTRVQVRDAREVLPLCANGQLLVVPDVSGYVGADTMACVIACDLHHAEDTVLLVDIGTNGEMVLSHRGRMAACSTAAGPALEGANIRFGMRGAPGAIDRVWTEDGALRCSTIGGAEAVGICGSGLIDAVAVLLEQGLLNRRGRIQTTEELDGQRIVRLTGGVYLTQDDVRQIQLAKGAIAAGIRLMAEHVGASLEEIDRVILAGAFGSFMRHESACRIDLLPPELSGRITAAGNAAGSGAKMLALDKGQLEVVQGLLERIEFLELASVPTFQHTFAKYMSFREKA